MNFTQRSAKLRHCAIDLLQAIGAAKRLNHFPVMLSGGERQGVAIARSLANRPSVLLADEPTGNLDTATGAEILRLIHDLHQKLQSTILVVTHDPGVAAQCQRVLKLRDGRIVEDVRQ